VRIGGLTLPLAEQTIAKALADGNFIKQPQVSILSLQMRSNQVSVLGLVNRAGRFPLETFNVRVSEMIAIAGVHKLEAGQKVKPVQQAAR